MLVSGMTQWPEDGQPAQLQRVGPFLPSASISGPERLIVSDEARAAIEAAGLQGIRCDEVHKKRIVRLDWRSWDLDAEDPERYPAGDEPENYVLGRKHNAELADAMGPIHEVVITRTVEDNLDADLMRTWIPAGAIVATDRARSVLRDIASEWLTFEPFA